MSDMREAFEKWCLSTHANRNNFYLSEGWKSAWHARDAEIEALKEEVADLNSELIRVEEERNNAIHREHEASEQMRACHNLLDKLGAPRNQDNGFSYHLNGRLSRLTHEVIQASWICTIETADAHLNALKAEHAALVEALRVVGPFSIVGGDAIRRLNPDSKQQINAPTKWAVGQSIERGSESIAKHIETINAAIEG